MSKILAVDIGNTHTKFAEITDDSYEYLGYVPTSIVATGEPGEPGEQRRGLFTSKKAKDATPRDDFSGCIISSVVPSKTQDVVEMIKRNFGIAPEFVPDDRGVGADLLASMEYAGKHFELPCCVFSLGTATTMYVLGENGQIQGGVICPGIEPSLEGLAVKAENLTYITPYETDTFLEFTTNGAMNSGIIYGTAGQVKELYKKVLEIIDIKTLVLAGGYSELISKYVEIPHVLERDIVLKGCYELYIKDIKPENKKISMYGLLL